ncbi:cytochrome P450 [Lipomyces doorenjongii]|uniref:cytochrome P450 n=1 Tax=Lipomyces doorenjongii TaxID=383834 RepID=UPI0034CE7459
MFSLEVVASRIAIAVSCLVLEHLFLSTKEDEPPLVKGPLPLLGSALAFLNNPKALLDGLQEKYGSIFTMYITGERLTVLTDPIFGITEVFNKRSLSFMPFQLRFCEPVWGYTKAVAMDLEFQLKLVHKTRVGLASKQFFEEISNTLKKTYLSLIDDSSQYANCDGEVIDLYEYCRYNMFYASARALFGPEFPVDKIYNPYILFEYQFPKFFRNYPQFLNREVLDQLGLFFADPSRVATSSLLFRSLYDEYMDSNYKSPADIAGYYFALLIGSKSNSVPGAFWLLANIVADAELKADVEEIIAKHYVAETDSFDWPALLQAPLISSSFKETLRLYGNAMHSRSVPEDIRLKVARRSKADASEVLFRGGSSIIMPVNLVHWNPDLYPEPSKWIGGRFLEKNLGVLVRGGTMLRYFIPWGGGADMCPGRQLANLEAVIQLVYTLARFDVQPVEPIPEVMTGRYATGMFKPARGYRVKFTRRKTPLVAVTSSNSLFNGVN